MMPYFWLFLIIIGVIVEAVSPQLVSIWFVFGFVGALISCYCGAPLWLQITIALVVSVGSLILTKPFVKKIMATKNASTNADMNIGKTAIVTKEIGTETGIVTVQGVRWTAFSREGKVIPVGKEVIVESIEGVKLAVILKED